MNPKIMDLTRQVCVVGFLMSCGLTLADANRPTAQATYLATAPVFDGRVKDDPAWFKVQPLTNFTQLLPEHGEPASLKTLVYVGYTDTDLHLAFIAYEDDVNAMDPSNNGWQSDSVVAVIDTYQNDITGYAFSTNQTGVEWDASIFNGNENWNWSTVWDAIAVVHDDNWSVEMVIPFTSLNYPKQDVQEWGFNFGRVIKRRNEVSHWAAIPRQFNMMRLQLAGTIGGLKPPPAKRNVKFLPYLITAEAEGRDAHLLNRSDFGFDVRYSLTPTLNLEGTFNTDFAQVESDRLQINTGRFSLFFPETRPFFLENSQLFTIGVPRETLIFHSRRIGIGYGGTRLPMDGGVKLTGHVGRQNEVGLMYLRADSASGEGFEDFSIARYSRSLPNRSKFGFLTTNRDSGAVDSQTYAGDFQWGIGERGEIRTFAAASRSNDGVPREDEYAYALYGNYNTPKYQSSASIHEVGSGFNPAMGFVQRRNSRKGHVASRRTVAMDGKWGLNEWRQLFNYTGYWDFDGYKESDSLFIESWFVWENGADIWTSVNVTNEGVRDPFYVVGNEVPSGEYASTTIGIGANTPYAKPWGIGGAVNAGGFYQGNNVGVGIWTRYEFNEHLNLNLGWNSNEVDFPTLDEPFNFALTSVGFSAAFTPKINLDGSIQYNEADKVWSTNVRFAWLRSASAGLFLVFSDINEKHARSEEQRQSIVLKYSHIFDVNF